jgi:HSP20 family protein
MPSRMRILFDHADYWAPNLDVQATPLLYVVSIKLPGLTGNEVNVMVDSGVLTFCGRRPDMFTRSISLPDDVEDARITVQYKTGVLTIRLPRMGQKSTPAFEFRRQ